jgi:hypothetical protein
MAATNGRRRHFTFCSGEHDDNEGNDRAAEDTELLM